MDKQEEEAKITATFDFSDIEDVIVEAKPCKCITKFLRSEGYATSNITPCAAHSTDEEGRAKVISDAIESRDRFFSLLTK